MTIVYGIANRFCSFIVIHTWKVAGLYLVYACMYQYVIRGTGHFPITPVGNYYVDVHEITYVNITQKFIF